MNIQRYFSSIPLTIFSAYFCLFTSPSPCTARAGGGKMGFYRRLTWFEPSPVLVTSPAMKATTTVHP
ncbi:MAG: hypothetical protein DRJ51_01905 [Thermoprotei archaeon]|nr:MAG: hypothetical protein DRJ51_01905 [Thermoprotei archaeon]